MESVVKRSLVFYLLIMVVGIFNLGYIDNLGAIMVNLLMVVISGAFYIGLIRDWKNLNTDEDTVLNNQS